MNTTELITKLRERYAEPEAPKCHICGAEMTVQRMSASRITYGCTGATYDDTGCHYAAGRSIADDHYEQSCVTIVDVSDPDVLALLDELEAKDRRIDTLRHDKDKIIDMSMGRVNRLLERAEAAEKRLSEITAPNMLLPAIDDFDESQLRHVIKTCTDNYSLLHSKWEAAEKRVAELEQRQHTNPCPKCNDTGMVDSGGTQPWGEPIEIECDCRQQDANTEELVAAGILIRINGEG